jgi:Transposase
MRGEHSGLSCFDPFLKLLGAQLDRSANYFVNQDTSGFVEGPNTKLRLLKRRCYDPRNIERFFQRFTLDVDGYEGSACVTALYHIAQSSPWRNTRGCSYFIQRIGLDG